MLDLAVVGIRFENGSLDHVKSFLVAARLSGEGQNTRFKIVAGITSRLKLLDYQRLRSLLGENQDLLDKAPNWLAVNTERNGKNDRFVKRDRIRVSF